MDNRFLILDYSGWWILVMLLVAGALSYFQYSIPNTPWNSLQNRVLAGIRFLAICAILLLFLSPAIRKVTNRLEKPLIGIALDNSESVVQRGSSAATIREKLDEIKNQLINDGFEVSEITINDSTAFTAQQSDITSLIKRGEEDWSTQNLVGILVASDGIYTRGSSPTYRNYIQPVYTIGLGDTIPPKDVSITRTRYNRVSYKGNETPIEVEITQQGYDNQTVELELKEGQTVIEKKSLRLRSQLQEATFVLSNDQEGLRRLSLSVSKLPEETTYANNETDVFMEVIDGKKKVLIVANSPHPDIKAIRTTLDATGNYETTLYIPSIHDEKPNEPFDVVVFHGAFTSGVNFELKENPGKWYILSNESAITTANKALPFFNIVRRGSQPDKVVGSFNQSFSKFKIEDPSVFESYPPIEVPFGDYTLSGPVEVLMYQKLGSIKTKKPLMAIYDDGSEKIGVSVGQNIWKWKLQESAITGSSQQFDLLVTKTIQFLSVSNDKSQFQFRSRKSNHSLSEAVLFDAQVYNDIYERIYGNEIRITITDEANNNQVYTFSDSPYNSTFRAPTLPAGIYQYNAETTIGDKAFKDQGAFAIQQINPEFQRLTADHNLLRTLSSKTGGRFRHLNNASDIIQDIRKEDFKPLIKSEEEIIPLYISWWYYIIIFVLFSTEWVLRRYWGGY